MLSILIINKGWAEYSNVKYKPNVNIIRIFCQSLFYSTKENHGHNLIQTKTAKCMNIHVLIITQLLIIIIGKT